MTASAESVTIAPVTPDMRVALALFGLKARLSFAVRTGHTDSFALHAAQGWAARLGYEGKPLRTSKLALAWVVSQQPDNN